MDWTEIKNLCLEKTKMLLADDGTPTEATAGAVSILVDTIIRIERHENDRSAV